MEKMIIIRCCGATRIQSICTRIGMNSGAGFPLNVQALESGRRDAELLLESGAKVAGVGIAQIGGNHHNGGTCGKQATPRFVHTFGLE